MYWRIGQRIVEEEQGGNIRAQYGDYIIRNLLKALKPEYGSGFGVRQLEQARQFYIEYPKANALRSQFNWTQYRALIQIPDKDKREYYELEAAITTGLPAKWSVRFIRCSMNDYYSAAIRKLYWPRPDKNASLKLRKRLLKTLWFLNFSGWSKDRNTMSQTLRMHLSTTFKSFYLNLVTALHSSPDKNAYCLKMTSSLPTLCSITV